MMDFVICDPETAAVRAAESALAKSGPWFSLSDAAAKTGIAFSTIAQAARDGRLPTLRMGRRQRFVRLSAVRAACSNERGRRAK